MQFRANPDGSITEIPPDRCPNGHELRYPNVIVAHWPEPGSGKHVRAWHCLSFKETIYDDEVSRRSGARRYRVIVSRAGGSSCLLSSKGSRGGSGGAVVSAAAIRAV